MKLFLHWLLWDLCLFRSMLILWTLLVLVYAAFLGWMHADILTIDPDWMVWSGPIALLLAATELLMLFHLFSTDPAGGVDPFWKTRPPTGFAVAGSKLVLALGFFVVLPMVAWLTMEALCLKPGAVTHEWREGVSWTRFLWLSQTLLVSVLALGAATVRTPWEIPFKLAQGLVLAALPALLAVVFKPQGMGVVGTVLVRVAQALVSPSAFWLWVAAGCGAFLLARWNRSPGRSWPWIVAALPCAILFVAPALPAGKPNGESEPPRPFPDPTAAEQIRIKWQPLRYRALSYSLPRNFAEDDTYMNAFYEVTLKVSGLPDELPADAVWREFRLTAPDGRVVEADRAAMERMRNRQVNRQSDVLNVTGLQLDTKEVKTLSLLPCRAEGVVRVFLRRRESAVLPVTPGAELETPMVWYGVSPQDFRAQRWTNVLMRTPRRSVGAFESISMERIATGENYEATIFHNPARTGWLMNSYVVESIVGIAPRVRSLANLRLKHELRDGPPAGEWRLKLTWWVPDGYVDVPVVLEPFILPQLKPDEKKVSDLIASVPLAAEADAERVGVAVRYVLMLANGSFPYEFRGSFLKPALEKWLQQVPAMHLPVLLGIARERASEYDWDSIVDACLSNRIAALMTADQAKELARAEPLLFNYLRRASKETGLEIASAEEPAPPRNTVDLTDQELAEHWEKDAMERSLPMDVLEEAVLRGLPWSKLVIVELMRLQVYGAEMNQMFRFMTRFSDCPEDLKKARNWLSNHAEQLEWDPALKRWVLPPPP